MKIEYNYSGIKDYIQLMQSPSTQKSTQTFSPDALPENPILAFNLEISLESKVGSEYQAHVYTLADIGYRGKAIPDLTQNEAKDLISERGFFGIQQTAKRMADFVITGANGREDFLRAGREGVLAGFHEAEALWGEELPEISYKTLELALTMIDEEMTKQGYSVLDMEG